MAREIELLIVGAGIHGLCMAKTYLELKPEAEILIVDKAQSLGGSWAEERLYPRLKTNNVLGSYEFSDFPMMPEKYGATPGTHIPGQVVHDYLRDVATHYGIDDTFQPRTIVEGATLQDDRRWMVTLLRSDPRATSKEVIITDKMVIATGLTSEPYLPTIPGQETFKGLRIHSKQLKECAPELAACKDVVVLGGNKSAWDVCYDAARSGARVRMVIRSSGGGPSYVWPKSFNYGPFNLSLARMSATRFFMAFDPTLFGRKGPMSWWHYFLHRTSIGNTICEFFWTRLDRHIKRVIGYHTHPELQKLEPWTTPFWMGNSLSIHNYETNWFDLVREGKITVHIADVESLSSEKVNLSNGETLHADALVCCTGWRSKPTVSFEVPDQHHDDKAIMLDIHKAESEIETEVKYLRGLSRRTSNAPHLKQQPIATSFLLSDHKYRFMVSPDEHALESKNLAFIGAHSSIHAVVVAQVQALWIFAFFNDKLKHLQARHIDSTAVRYNTILHGVYGMLRRPKECGGASERYPDLVFDSVPYVDILLQDLELGNLRKRGIWNNIFKPHLPADYRGLVKEWKTKNSVEVLGES
ncbi:hypothetical protein PV08_09893 [Exophiala spinifera]|uniref:FAD/NAD(P)-binding domain-containing protein n=1 Tax=Exophiala spinifera TaxID=91928 RepID=A0A0D2B1Y9_9EURO|nr:uncharacterized protein PV08_09893 [Exophiala spinifera]KIW12615.1 hypothetical protein PV08_09893 [Exophiala spinifera]